MYSMYHSTPPCRSQTTPCTDPKLRAKKGEEANDCGAGPGKCLAFGAKLRDFASLKNSGKWGGGIVLTIFDFIFTILGLGAV